MENERIARVEEQLKWMAPRVERIEMKVDQLLSFKWQIIGGSSVVGFLSAMLVEWITRK